MIKPNPTLIGFAVMTLSFVILLKPCICGKLQKEHQRLDYISLALVQLQIDSFG